MQKLSTIHENQGRSPMLAHESFDTRVRRGKIGESGIKQNLVKYFDFKVDDPTEQEDMVEKVDAYLTHPRTPKRLSAQLKFRESGNDLLYCVYEPFFGVDHPD